MTTASTIRCTVPPFSRGRLVTGNTQIPDPHRRDNRARAFATCHLAGSSTLLRRD